MSALDIREDTFSIRVGNLSSDTTLDDLKYTFSKFGNVSNIYVPKPPGDEFRGIRDPKEVRCLKNVAFIRYFGKEEADKAIAKLNGKVIEGRRLELCLQKNRRYIQEMEMQVKMLEAKGMDASAFKRELEYQTDRYNPVKKEEYNSRSPKRELDSRDRDRDYHDRRDYRDHRDRERDYHDRRDRYESSRSRYDDRRDRRRSRSRSYERRNRRSPKGQGFCFGKMGFHQKRKYY